MLLLSIFVETNIRVERMGRACSRGSGSPNRKRIRETREMGSDDRMDMLRKLRGRDRQSICRHIP